MRRYWQRLLQKSPFAEAGEQDHGLWRWLEATPLLIPIFLSVFGVVTVGLLCLNELSNLLVIVLALPVAIAVTVFTGLRLGTLRFPGSVQERRVGLIVLMVFICGWTMWNAKYSSEDIYINRDPALYNVTARWLMDNDNLVIYGSEVFGDDNAIAPDTAGYGLVKADGDGRIYAQAPHFFPILMGLAGRVAGVDVMVKANAIIGGLALLAVYGVIRMFVRPRWAVLSVFLLSVSLPMFYFSRDTYTEPLAMLLVFGAFSAIAAARNSKNWWLWAIAGVVAGSSVLARIDAYLLLAGFVGAIFVLHLMRPREERGSYIRGVWAFLGGAAVPGLLGFWDVSELSRRYFIDLNAEFVAQITLLIGILVGGAVMLCVEHRTGFVEKLMSTYGRLLLKILLIVVVVGAVFLASRPLWMVSHEAGNPYSRPYIASLQARDGAEIDPHRNYAEHSVMWVSWYIGPVILALGFLGFLLSIKFVFDRKDDDLVPILLVVGVMAALYFFMPKITADQIWAIRRFLPVIIPGLCLFSAIALQQLFGAIRHGRYKLPLLLVVIAAAAWPILQVSSPFLRNKEYASQLVQIERICDALPRKSAVLLVGQNGINMTQTIRAYCEVPAERLLKPTDAQLQEAVAAAREQGYVPVAFVIGYEAGLVADSMSDFTDVGEVAYQEMRRELTHPPREVDHFTRHILLGEIKPDGSLVPITKN